MDREEASSVIAGGTLEAEAGERSLRERSHAQAEERAPALQSRRQFFNGNATDTTFAATSLFGRTRLATRVTLRAQLQMTQRTLHATGHKRQIINHPLLALG